jgi:glycerophosphoryl diester phosphodiesterase
MKQIIIAHRGASGYEYQNTIRAFDKAVECGADMVEFDVRRTADGQMVVIHDSEIADKAISALSISEAKELARSKGFDLPTLAEVLESLEGRIMLDVELKESGYESNVIDLVRTFFSDDKLLVTSFDDVALAFVKKMYPGVSTGLLLGVGKPKQPIRTRIREMFPFKRAKSIQADYLIPHWKIVMIPMFLLLARYFGFRVIVWGTNDVCLARKLSTCASVCGFITDYPDVFRQG